MRRRPTRGPAPGRGRSGPDDGRRRTPDPPVAASPAAAGNLGIIDGLAQLRRIAFLLERAREPTPRVRAFRRALAVLEELPADELAERIAADTLTELDGIGPATAKVMTEAAAGETSSYLRKLEASYGPLVDGGEEHRAALHGDLHLHSNWSDGGSSIEEMARTARDLGHDYIALTDHSPRLKVARGLSAERLAKQLEVVAELNEKLAPFRILTGIEVDILEDGSLDQKESVLAQLDVVVASVHSKLRMDKKSMTRRMIAAIASPHVDVLGHCTGRLITGERGTRGESAFDADLVFAACAQFDVAVEINSRPERLDPPRRLLRQAADAGCLFAIDTDAHAPGQLDFQPYGCARAEECGVSPDRIVNTRSADELLAWTARRR